MISDVLSAARPASTGCSACGRPWTAHTLKPIDDRYPCTTCGALLTGRCFYTFVATAEEVRRFEDPDDNMEGVAFMCAGCRS